jgi:hypothetical protein
MRKICSPVANAARAVKLGSNQAGAPMRHPRLENTTKKWSILTKQRSYAGAQRSGATSVDPVWVVAHLYSFVSPEACLSILFFGSNWLVTPLDGRSAELDTSKKKSTMPLEIS